MDYTATALLASIRRRGALPSATSVGTADADLLSIANEELQSWLVPLVLSLREDYLLVRETQSTVASQSEYRIPKRAVGMKLREVEIVTSTSIRNLTRIEADGLEDWPTSNGTPTAFYLRGNHVVLVPTPATTETLRLSYFLRPSEITATAADYETITAVNTSTNTITVADTTGLTGSVDLVSSTGMDVLSVAASNNGTFTGTTLAFDALPVGLAVGDYVCVADKSPVPNVPADFHPLLAQRVAVKVLESTGMQGKHELASRQLSEMEESLRQTYAPRVDGEVKICAPDSYGLMGGTSVLNNWWD